MENNFEKQFNDLQEFNRYCLQQLQTIFNCLDYSNISSLRERKIGMAKYARNIVDSISLLLDLSSTKSLAPFITINRMIIDNFSIFSLLSSAKTNEEEKNIRYYLFLMDAVKTRSEVVLNFHNNLKPDIIKITSDHVQTVMDNDREVLTQLLHLIHENDSENILHHKIISQNNWKYKNPQNSKDKKYNSFNWRELYQLAGIPSHYAGTFQNYYSAYTHGLGITLMNRTEENILSLICPTLSIICKLQALMAKILLTEYEDKVAENILDVYFLIYMNENSKNWN